ncbi:hypothetical protein MIND_00420100 [Mycena indigotica]|uniref:Uncharacterized protein n=1 Tax=Mycena indigotica TaxID=2126181 RepID=A0A8H6SVL0_9AGAR|nr:uncharacterized protein MIND_00420100 [Mycena indigotica]KAF7306291.1 hypothetical protein MIND_00420100 [Mycena indigotica]
MTEFDPTLTTSVVNALYKFVTLANSMLRSNNTGVEQWTATRWEDFVMTLQWLYDNHPNGTASQALLIDTMERLKWTGVPWEKVFSKQESPTCASVLLTLIRTTVFSYRGSRKHAQPIQSALDLAWSQHGRRAESASRDLSLYTQPIRLVTDFPLLSLALLGDQIWTQPVWVGTCCFSIMGGHQASSLITPCSTLADILPGIYAADEYLAGLEATRGTELCLVVETMFSGSYLYQVIGDPKFSDRVERIAYNALPATLTGDMWNSNLVGFGKSENTKLMSVHQRICYNSGYGIPCACLSGTLLDVGHSRSRHILFLVKMLANNVQVMLSPPMSQRTNFQLFIEPYLDAICSIRLYPFSDTLTTTITAKSAFTYQVRIPGWVVNGTIAINGAPAKPLAPVNGLQAVAANSGTTTFVLNLPAVITTEARPHGAIAVHRGPLNYAFDIPRKTKVLATNADQPMAQDLEFDATASWQYAIDPATLAFSSTPPSSGVLPSPIFDSGLTPSKITARACLINWAIQAPTFAAKPPTNPTCTGPATTITLTPYGATKLRISEFPTFKST